MIGGSSYGIQTDKEEEKKYMDLSGNGAGDNGDRKSRDYRIGRKIMENPNGGWEQKDNSVCVFWYITKKFDRIQGKG